jgi:hypothetical protein
MIKFFRIIRKNLLNEGKTTKYLKYAIGEIVLVVIGILIALQINNWNEERKDKILQMNYSQQLSDNLEKDIVHLKESIELNKFFDDESFYLLDYLLNNLTNPDSLRLAIATHNASGMETHTSNPSVYNDLINTGNLKLYHDPIFKELLNTYFINASPNLDRHLETEIWERYVQEVIKYVDPLLWKTINIERNYPNFGNYIDLRNNIDLRDYEIDWEGMRNSKELKIKLKKAIASRALANRIVKEYLDKAIELENYIKENKDNL